MLIGVFIYLAIYVEAKLSEDFPFALGLTSVAQTELIWSVQLP